MRVELVDDSAVAFLTHQGFTPKAATTALRATRGDLQRSYDMLDEVRVRVRRGELGVVSFGGL